jgi:hypothetical protein
MSSTRSWHLSPIGCRRGDSGEAEEEEGERVGQRCWGCGERGKEEVEDVEVGRGEEARNPTSCQRCRTTRPYNHRDSRGGKYQWWSQGVDEQEWVHRLGQVGEKISLRRMSGRGCIDWSQNGEKIGLRRMIEDGRINWS